MITGILTHQDYICAQRLHRQKITRNIVLLGSLAILLGMIPWLLLGPWPALCLIGGGIGMLLGEWLVYSFSMPRRARRILTQQKELAQPIHYQWDADFIEGQTISGTARRPWAMYYKFKEDQHSFILYHAENLFEIIPKAWFSSPEQTDDFRRCIGKIGAT